MEAIEAFIKDLFLLEAKAQEAYWEENPDLFNEMVDQLRAVVASPSINFGLEKRTAALTSFELMMKDAVDMEFVPRPVLKISEYSMEDQVFYVLYTTIKNPKTKAPSMADAFIISQQDDTVFKILAWWQFDDLDGGNYEWKYAAGEEGLHPKKLGELVRVERYLSPEEPQAAVEDYLADN